MNALTDETSPRVFISYVHNDGSVSYRAPVLDLANRLLADGVNCEIDQFHETTPPSKGWTRWMLDEIQNAKYVLVVCTATYYKRFRADEQPNMGLGAIWEGGAITQALYEGSGHNTKFIPIGFAGYGEVGPFIPEPLRQTTYRNVSTEDGYEALLRQIHVAPKIVKPAIGKRPDFASYSPNASGTRTVAPTTSVKTSQNVDRGKLIDVLDGMDSNSLTSVITRLPDAGRYDNPNLTVSERVASLVRFAESTVGPGLNAVATVVVQRFPSTKDKIGPF